MSTPQSAYPRKQMPAHDGSTAVPCKCKAKAKEQSPSSPSSPQRRETVILQSIDDIDYFLHTPVTRISCTSLGFVCGLPRFAPKFA